jgi:putative ABC transport system permease protein
MRPADLASETVLSLTNNKVRSALTILGIVVGIASVILMVSIGQGSQKSIEGQIRSAGSNLLMVRPGGGQRTMAGGATAPGTLTSDDVKAIARVPGVAAVAPQVSTQKSVANAGTSVDVRIVGVTAADAKVNSIETSTGSFFDDAQGRSASKIAVLGPTTAADLFGEGSDPTGSDVRVGGMKFSVIGVTKSKGGSVLGSSDEVVYVPIKTAQAFLTGSDDVSMINVTAADEKQMDAVKAAITTTLLEAHGITDADAADFSILSQSDLLKTASSVTGTLTALLAAISGISLVVGGIGIMNMMLTTVTERTREIGLRKAIGARPADITSQFLAESVALTVIGGVIGIAIGWGLSGLVSLTGVLQTDVSIQAIAIAVVVCTGIGVVFGYYPARRAAKLDPIEALRYQ